MLKLHRLTSEYIAGEDRFRLTAEDEAGNTISLWLTQRLCQRLISYLLATISKTSNETIRSAAQDADLLQEFAQQAATADLPNQPAVDSALSSQNWLVEEVDINTGEDDSIGLVFKKEGVENAAIGFDSQQVRQWLSIVRSQWILAEWPMGIWPSWMAVPDESIKLSTEIPFH